MTGGRLDELLANVGAYYGRCYRQHGDSPQGMDWKDSASQELRFALLVSRMDWSRAPSIIDVGCGNGELLAYCRRRGLDPTYRGLDVCEDMVAACRRRFGEAAATLGSTRDLARWGWRADYVIASGTFNVKQDAPAAVWSRYVGRTVREMFEASTVAALFNVTSSLATLRYPRLYYMDPGQVGRLARRCGTTRFFIEHTAPLFELTAGLLH